MNLKVQEQFEVKSYETDVCRRLKPFFLQSHVQEMAYKGSEFCGAGYELLRSQGFFWALNRLHLHILDWPLWGEEVVLQTWSRAKAGHFAISHVVHGVRSGRPRNLCIKDWLPLRFRHPREQVGQGFRGKNVYDISTAELFHTANIAIFRRYKKGRKLALSGLSCTSRVRVPRGARRTAS